MDRAGAPGWRSIALLFWRALRTYPADAPLVRISSSPSASSWLAAALVRSAPARLPESRLVARPRLRDRRDRRWSAFTVAYDLRRGAGTLAAAARRPRAAPTSSPTEEAFLGSHVRALLVELAEKDAYTEEHTRRVALRAVAGRRGARTRRPRACASLALGGLLHDIGKLTVPDEILQEAGPLDRRRVRTS